MQDAFFCLTVDDVGMEGYSTPSHLERILQFCDEEQIKATFFVVPRPLGKPFQQSAYGRLLDSARQAGHAIGQHGLEHGRFEAGIPPKMVLDLSHEGPAREHLANHREEIERSLSVENLCGRLREGRAILGDILGYEVEGFRAPCLSVCDNLFVALEAERYLYDSSRFFQKAAWDMFNGVANPKICPITRETFDRQQSFGRLRLFPLTAEYTWYLTHDQFDTFLRLAKHDFDACLTAGIPFVTLSHVSPIQEGDGDSGFALYRELLKYSRQSAEKQGKQLVSATLSDVRRVWDLRSKQVA